MSSQGGKQLDWRCYARDTITTDGYFYKGGKGYISADVQSLIEGSSDGSE